MKYLLPLLFLFSACSVSGPEYTGSVSLPAEQVTVPPFTAPQTSPNKNVTRLDLRGKNVAYLNTDVNTRSANVLISQIEEFGKTGKPIYLSIDSPGGSVVDGARIVSAMQASPVPIYTVCTQICASMAAIILEYGTERYAVDRSIIMFHPASLGGFFAGKIDEIISRLSFLKNYVDKMTYYVALRSKNDYEKFRNSQVFERWIDAEDALAANLIDKIVSVKADPLPEALKVSPEERGKNKVKDLMDLRWE